MRLDGWQCDNCGIRSASNKGSWYQVQTMRVSQGAYIGTRGSGPGSAASFSEGMHYCSKECLMKAAKTWT